MRTNQIEFLLMLSENAAADGDELIKEQTRINVEHARRLLELQGMIDRAKTMVDAEVHRFARYVPAQAVRVQTDEQGRIPRVITGAGNEVKRG